MRVIEFLWKHTLCRLGRHFANERSSIFRRPRASGHGFDYFETTLIECLFCGFHLAIKMRGIDIDSWWESGG